MPRSRTLPVPRVATSCVIGLLVGTALVPVLLGLLGRGETSVPPVAFITVAIFCWGLVPRLVMEFLPDLLRRAAPVPAAAPVAPESAGDGPAERR